MEKPIISIIIPAYNAEQYLGRTLDSLLSQDFSNVEVIVVDDCSKDSTAETIKSYAEKDSRVKPIILQENCGPMWARKLGYEKAEGNYIAFCDSDDTMPVSALRELYEEAVKSDADIVVGQARYIYPDGSQKEKRNILKYGASNEAYFKSLLLHECGQELWAKLYKASLFKDYEYENFKHFINGEDAYLLYQVVRNCKMIRSIGSNVYDYYQVATSSTHVKRDYNRIEFIFFGQSGRIKLLEKFPKLYRLTQANATKIFLKYYWGPYDHRLIESFLSKHNLKNYVEFRSYISLLSIKDIMVIRIKATIKRLGLDSLIKSLSK